MKTAGYTGYILEKPPEKVLQFGKGNFLRAFVDYWFDLANFGLDVAYVTKLPTYAIGQAAVNSLRRYGVDTGIVRGGIYFNEKGASQRGSVCTYDWVHSAVWFPITSWQRVL